jgi:hypothetical protein
MWEDLYNNRPTEVDYLNGVITRLGREHKVSTPINTAIIALVKVGHTQSFSRVQLKAMYTHQSTPPKKITN